MRRTVLGLALLLFGACTVPESENPAPRCELDEDCPNAHSCYRGYCIEDEGRQIDPVELGDAGRPALSESDGAQTESDGGAAPPAMPTADVPPAMPPADVPPADVPPADVPPTEVPPVDPSGSIDASIPDANGSITEDAQASSPADAAADAQVSLPNPGTPLACAGVCLLAGRDEAKCKRCVESAFGVDVDKLCGKYKPNGADEHDDDDDDDDLGAIFGGRTHPLCISLCLGAARNQPLCLPLLPCTGPKCGGKS